MENALSFISANSNVNIRILTQGADVQVATYLDKFRHFGNRTQSGEQ